MGHFSDFTYLQRGVTSSFLFFYLAWSLWRSDRLRSLSLYRLRRFELKSIVCWIMLIALPLELYYDYTEVRITYNEGFIIVKNVTYVKPQSLWTQDDLDTNLATDYIFDVALSLEASILFLLQCFWNYLANSIVRKSFMSSLEWKVYMVWAFATLLLLPMLQLGFSSFGEKLYAEVFPQMIYAFELVVVAALGLLSHIRFNRLINTYEVSKRQLKDDTIISKLTYFREMNGILSINLCILASMVLMLCFDAFSPGHKLNSSKQITDTAICISNTCGIIVWVVLISIFFPPRPFLTTTSQHALSATTDSAKIQMTPIISNGVYPYQPQGGNMVHSVRASQPLSHSQPHDDSIVKTVTVEVDDTFHGDETLLRNSTFYPS